MTEPTRAEHVAWCKQRALEYVERGELTEALTSMINDLMQHPATRGHSGIMLTGMMMMAGIDVDTPEKVRRHIEGFQ